MQRINRFLGFLIIAALFLGSYSAFVLAQTTTTSLLPALQTVGVGEQVTVTLRVDDVTDFYGYQAELQFDPTLLQVVDTDPGTTGVQVQVLNGFLHPDMLITPPVNNAAGTIMCTVMQMSPTMPVNGSGDLFAITFQGVAEGVSDISFVTLDLFNEVGTPIGTTLVPAQIQVGTSASTSTPTATATSTEATPTVTPTPTPTPTTTPLAMGNLLKGIASDLNNDRLYVAVQSNNTVAVLGGTPRTVNAVVPSGGLAPLGLALSADGSRLFVVNSGSDQVAVLDTNNNYAVIATIGVGRRPFGIAIANDIAYVTNFDDGTVSLIDTTALAVLQTVWVGHHPALPAAVGDHAYIPIHSAFSRWDAKDSAAEWDYVQKNKGNGTGLAIVYGDGRPDPVSYVLTEYIGFFATAVDEINGRVYVTKRDGTAEGLYVIDAADHSLIKFVPMLRPYVVAVNPQIQHVFVVQADMDEFYVLDGTNGYRMIRAVNTDPNNGDIPGMHGGQGICMHGTAPTITNYAAGTLGSFDYGSSPGFAVPIDTDYIRGWQESGGNHGPLNVPVAPATSYWYSEQQYERGSMHWRQVSGGTNKVYVFDNESTMTGGTDWMGRDDGVWSRFDDSWTSGMPLLPAGCPDAAWPYGPMFGFGVTWCSNPDTVKARIGHPIGWEYGTLGGDQQFAYGIIFWNPASDAYFVLRSDTHTWRYFRAHRRYEAEIEPNIVGQVQLQGRTDNQGVILTSLAGPHTATVDENGTFGLHYIGPLELVIHHAGYLDVVATVKADADTTLNTGAITMLGGDANGDNRIDILDISYVGYRFSSVDAGADLNGDGTVNILDLSLVGANFGQTGPVRWQR